MQVTTSSYAKRLQFIYEFAIWSKFLYAIIAAINYPHITYCMIYKYISWKIQLTITFTKRAERLNEFAIWSKLINMVISSIRYVYVTCLKIYCNTRRNDKLSWARA